MTRNARPSQARAEVAARSLALLSAFYHRTRDAYPPRTCDELATKLRLPSNEVMGQLISLRHIGLAVSEDYKGSNNNKIWTITERGIALRKSLAGELA